MNETEPEDSVSFEPSLFFHIQRQLGLDPLVMGEMVGGRTLKEPKMECLLCWANKSDPDGKKRAEYAAKRWNERSPGDVIVRLG